MPKQSTSVLAYGLFFVAVGTLVSFARNTVWFVPLDLYLTAWHEAMHAGAAWLTGGAVHEVNVHAGHGTTVTSGGFFPLISMAGYFGTALWGCVLLASLRIAYLRKPVMWVSLVLPLLVMLFGGGLSKSLLLLTVFCAIIGIVWNKVGHWVGLVFSVIYASESFKDIQVYVLQSPHETDAGILADYLGLSVLTLPIAVGLAGLTLLVWCFVLKWTMLTKQTSTTYYSTPVTR